MPLPGYGEKVITLGLDFNQNIYINTVYATVAPSVFCQRTFHFNVFFNL